MVRSTLPGTPMSSNVAVRDVPAPDPVPKEKSITLVTMEADAGTAPNNIPSATTTAEIRPAATRTNLR